jgi:hypothetical protein
MILPDWARVGPFISVTRTTEELSIVCPEDAVPSNVHCERGWRCLRLVGTLDLTLVGVLASLLQPLADASVGVFVVSTFDTDYVLVKAPEMPRAMAALRRAGHVLVA